MSVTSIEEARKQLSDLEGLIHSPGWAILDAAAKLQEESYMQRAFTATDAHAAAKFLGAAMAIKELRNFPMATGMQFRQYIQELADEVDPRRRERR